VDAERYSSNYQTGGIINTASHIKQKWKFKKFNYLGSINSRSRIWS
jgi:hypothetical protein